MTGSDHSEGLLAGYRATLKAVEVEEILDLFLYRPLAYGLVRIVLPTRITPDQITFISLLLGLAAGVGYATGTVEGLRWGALLLFLTNTVDCADGMLARLRGGGSLTGYVFDGLVDYTTNTAVLVGMLVGLGATGTPAFIWLVGVPGGLSYAWWSAMVDRFRNEWLGRVYGKRSDPAAEVAAMEATLATYPPGTHRWDRILVGAYGLYARLWYSAPGTVAHRALADVPLAEWQQARRPVMRTAVLFGPTFHLSLMMLAGALDQVAAYLWFSLVVGTGWGGAVLLWRRVVDRRLLGRLPEGASH